jgi:hypothetical protein
MLHWKRRRRASVPNPRVANSNFELHHSHLLRVSALQAWVSFLESTEAFDLGKGCVSPFGLKTLG